MCQDAVIGLPAHVSVDWAAPLRQRCFDLPPWVTRVGRSRLPTTAGVEGTSDARMASSSHCLNSLEITSAERAARSLGLVFSAKSTAWCLVPVLDRAAHKPPLATEGSIMNASL